MGINLLLTLPRKAFHCRDLLPFWHKSLVRAGAQSGCNSTPLSCCLLSSECSHCGSRTLWTSFSVANDFLLFARFSHCRSLSPERFGELIRKREALLLWRKKDWTEAASTSKTHTCTRQPHEWTHHTRILIILSTSWQAVGWCEMSPDGIVISGDSKSTNTHTVPPSSLPLPHHLLPLEWQSRPGVLV